MSDLTTAERTFSPNLARIKLEVADVTDELPNANAMLDVYHAVLEQ